MTDVSVLPERRCFYPLPGNAGALRGALSVHRIGARGEMPSVSARRQGRTHVSAFEATQSVGTAQLAVLKLLVKSVCVLAALIAIGMSVWISLPLLREAAFIQMWNVRPNSLRSVIKDAVAALTGYEQFSLVVVGALGVVIWVAAFAVFGALRTRYSRRVNIAGSLLLLYGLALGLLALAGPKRGRDPRFRSARSWGQTSWVRWSAIVLATGYSSGGVRGAPADAALSVWRGPWSRRHSGRHG